MLIPHHGWEETLLVSHSQAQRDEAAGLSKGRAHEETSVGQQGWEYHFCTQFTAARPHPGARCAVRELGTLSWGPHLTQGQSPCGSLRVSMDSHHLRVPGGPPDVLEGCQPPEPAPPRVQLLGLWLQRLLQNLPSEATAGTGCGETELFTRPPRSNFCPPGREGPLPLPRAPTHKGQAASRALSCWTCSALNPQVHVRRYTQRTLHSAPGEAGVSVSSGNTRF